MKNILLCILFFFCTAGIALADSCPSTYPVLYGGQCCTQSCSRTAMYCPPQSCVPSTPSPTTPTAPSISTATVKYVPIPIDDGISAIIPAEKNLPKDPGTAGDATVAGVITNPYGVRDDVMRGIVYAYPNNPKAQTVLFNMAKNYQAILANSTSAAIVRQNMAEAAAWNKCLVAVTGDPEALNNLLRPLVLDSYDRSISYLTALQSIEGNALSPAVVTQCP